MGVVAVDEGSIDIEKYGQRLGRIRRGRIWHQ
jgi:hypothetical protein